ncbi:MAG: TVP38/TMEM64 family protein [DPANN group archaeon]|nr:TVP38/TMEM64 family protein [DPANN group archaeon]
MEKSHNRRFLTIFVVLIGLMLLSYLFLSPAEGFFTHPARIRAWLLQFGILSPFVYMLLQIIQVIISAIPGQALSIAGGYVFGAWFGTIYNTIGTMVGSLIVFWLTRKYGRSLAESFIKEKEMRHLDRFFRRQGPVPIILVRLIPFFPNDAVSFFLGLTKISYWTYTWTTFLGFLPQFIILNMLGESMSTEFGSPLMILLTVLMTLFGTFYLFRQRLKILFLREVKEAEQELSHLTYAIERDSEESLDFLKKEL